jgi:hypothetical protein
MLGRDKKESNVSNTSAHRLILKGRNPRAPRMRHVTPMRTSILFATACAALMAMPALLAPAADAGPQIPSTDLLDPTINARCNAQISGLHGWVALIHRGYFPAKGGFNDGCGSHGCDDGVSGTFHTGHGDYDFGVAEWAYSNGGCQVSCGFDSSTGWHGTEYGRGSVEPWVPAPNGVVFSCSGYLHGCLESVGTYCEDRLGSIDLIELAGVEVQYA